MPAVRVSSLDPADMVTANGSLTGVGRAFVEPLPEPLRPRSRSKGLRAVATLNSDNLRRMLLDRQRAVRRALQVLRIRYARIAPAGTAADVRERILPNREHAY